ncbi:MAG TPA: carboxypeptidase-like regulatory domain-containing protein [Pyrinomonadaceae bacterium]|nr:carboxypeptidase-like regulatory domain-containing protein [Pyrinomonadaceae bacterium]
MKQKIIVRRITSNAVVLGVSILMILTLSVTGLSQRDTRKISGVGGGSKKVVTPKTTGKKPVVKKKGDDEIIGVRLKTEPGVQRTNAEIQQSELFFPGSKRPMLLPEREIERDEDSKAQNPDAPAVSQWPIQKRTRRALENITADAHTLGSAFDAATLTDTSSFPPDSNGAAGPTQYIGFQNGRIRSFNKFSGLADGVMNLNPDVFYASVMTPIGGGVVANFTTDPQIRYDRFTSRWFLIMIDVPCLDVNCTSTAANRVVMAVSDAASNGTITAGTVWTFFQFKPSPTTEFCDYESLGVDVNALYVGCNMFSAAGSFTNTNGYVIQKSSVLGAGPAAVTAFPGLLVASAGPFAPRGVDNYDLGATEGYFVGPDNATFSTIMFRRVSNPGTVSPTISGNISVSVPTTTFPNRVEHLGNTGGLNGGLDALDDRLYQAMIRNGRLWTAHNFRVTAAGVASTAAESRNASRWYEFQNLTTTPTIVQSGTVFDNSATRAAARQYTIPSIVATGQGHAVIGFTMAGTPVGPTPAFASRLSGDTAGTMAGPPTTPAVTFGTTTANYNPASDPGGASGRRWGDYSATVVDPLDDMTVWTAQQYNQASNSYAVRVGRLLAPPPATPVANSIASGVTNVNLVITGTSSAGSGFYDPGPDLPAPARPFNHIQAAVSGTNVVVNSVTYTSPTSITLNLTTTGAAQGARILAITNPDGQQVTGTLTINPPTAANASISGRVTSAEGRGIRGAVIRIQSSDGAVNRVVMTNSMGYYMIPDMETGITYVISIQSRRFVFEPASVVYTHQDQIADLNFRAQ